MSIVQAVEEALRGKTSINQAMSWGLHAHLDQAQSTLDQILPNLYYTLCRVEPQAAQAHIIDFNAFSDDVNGDLVTIRMNNVSLLSASDMPSPAPTVVSAAPHSGRLDTRHLHRLDALKFSGQVEDFPKFKRNWLARFGHLENDTQLQYLKPSLPPKDQSKVSAVTTVVKCWRRLGRVYGDRQINIVTVKTTSRGSSLRATSGGKRT